MLLEKKYNTETGIEKAIYDSSNILASFYNERTKELTIIFYKQKDISSGFGNSYTYKDVTPVDYVWLRSQESQGKIIFSYIKKGGYEFNNNGKYDITELLKEKVEGIDKPKIVISVDPANGSDTSATTAFKINPDGSLGIVDNKTEE